MLKRFLTLLTMSKWIWPICVIVLLILVCLLSQTFSADRLPGSSAPKENEDAFVKTLVEKARELQENAKEDVNAVAKVVHSTAGLGILNAAMHLPSLRYIADGKVLEKMTILQDNLQEIQQKAITKIRGLCPTVAPADKVSVRWIT